MSDEENIEEMTEGDKLALACRRLVEITAETLQCSKCKYPIALDWRICPKCGNVLIEV